MYPLRSRPASSSNVRGTLSEVQAPCEYGTLVVSETSWCPSSISSMTGTEGQDPEPVVVTISRSPADQARMSDPSVLSTVRGCPAAVGSPAYPGDSATAQPDAETAKVAMTRAAIVARLSSLPLSMSASSHRFDVFRQGSDPRVRRHLPSDAGVENLEVDAVLVPPVGCDAEGALLQLVSKRMDVVLREQPRALRGATWPAPWARCLPLHQFSNHSTDVKLADSVSTMPTCTVGVSWCGTCA
ncbi:hypothetical protein SRABI76_00501 [Microbacterium oxydans]|nr:hypothetical protein SRABI76_00501 [Microbacterium oxydans]